MTRELVLVCGPAGFGKSTLLADWVRDDGRAVAWLSLDEGDNDPVRFWRHVAAALDGARARGRASGRARWSAAGRRPRSMAAVTALVNDLAWRPSRRGAGGGRLPPDPGPGRAPLGGVPAGSPAARRCALVLASRSDPPLPLARLRARGQLAELRAADLRFTAGRGRRAAARSRRDTTCPTRSSRRWASAPRAGSPGCSWPRCRCGGARDVGRIRRGVLRQPPLRPGLPDRGGAGPAVGRS